jgi:hypothetical protein
MYNYQVQSLGADLTVTPEQSKAALKRFFKAFPGTKEWVKKMRTMKKTDMAPAALGLHGMVPGTWTDIKGNVHNLTDMHTSYLMSVAALLRRKLVECEFLGADQDLIDQYQVKLEEVDAEIVGPAAGDQERPSHHNHGAGPARRSQGQGNQN